MLQNKNPLVCYFRQGEALFELGTIFSFKGKCFVQNGFQIFFLRHKLLGDSFLLSNHPRRKYGFMSISILRIRNIASYAAITKALLYALGKVDEAYAHCGMPL
jgi:hypothetical protein